MATASLRSLPYAVVNLTERVNSPGHPGRVDRTAGVIRNVKILGRVSANGREYSASAISKAKGLYEGARVNCDHRGKGNEQRKIVDRFGTLRHIREQADGLYGDLHYIKGHPLENFVCNAAESHPHALGLSHDAEGKVTTRGGKTIVEEIMKVRSVDLVADPATVSGLFESRQHDRAAERQRLNRVFAEAAAIDVMRGRARWTEGAAGEDEMPTPEPGEATTVDTPDKMHAVKDSFLCQIWDTAGNDTMTIQERLKKIEQLLTAMNDATAAIEAGGAITQESRLFESRHNQFTFAPPRDKDSFSRKTFLRAFGFTTDPVKPR